MHVWYGVVLKIFTNQSGGTVLQVQTVRNVFRGYPPEFIEVEAAPEAISLANRADLEQEIKHLQQMREFGLQQMLSSINNENTEVTDNNPLNSQCQPLPQL